MQTVPFDTAAPIASAPPQRLRSNCKVANCSHACDCLDDTSKPTAQTTSAPRSDAGPHDATLLLDPAHGGGCLFLKRTGEHNHWVIWARGIKGVPTTELPLPVPCDASLAAVIRHLREAMPTKLGGAWLSYRLA